MDALHPKREPPQIEQKSPAIADEQKQSTPHQECPSRTSSPAEQRHQKVKLTDINSSLTCHLCKGYLIDATTISECLHSFCRSCIIKFLEENSFCPVCEVIINKAKPNLKLDKALQDIVYKLVPGLFLCEMMRRQRFYSERPTEAAKVLPEQRGEDTERTIFNPQDRISLSLEYIGDHATTSLILKDLKQRQEGASDNPQVESLLKRYLQCPAMCRIDVIKKFIRNKYNVNTDLFQIDILYKRVPLPLPDHYTLIDVAYIYTWKRNEPMRFYFRIIEKGNDELPDLTKVFTPVDDSPFLHQPLALSTPHRLTRKSPARNAKDKNKKTPKKSVARKLPVAKPAKRDRKDNAICDKPNEGKETKRKRYISELEEEETREESNGGGGGSKKLPMVENDHPVSDPKNITNDRCTETVSASKSQADMETKPDTTRFKKETKVSIESCDNGKVYTNITLKRSNNVEIVTKIQKLSDKDCKQIEVNVIDQSARQNSDTKDAKDDQCTDAMPTSSSEDVKMKTELETNVSGTVQEEVPPPINDQPESKPEATLPNREPKQKSPSPEVTSTTNDLPPMDKELEKTKFEFLKSIELTAKKVVDNIAKLVHQQQQNIVVSSLTSTQQNLPVPQNSSHATKANEEPSKPTKLASTNKQETNVLKRKPSSSPIKNESKRAKVEQKKTTKIILQQKPGFPPLNLAKATGTIKTPEDLMKQNGNELRSLFQTCRLNIPSSLSITLKENGEASRQPVQMPPVQNFIEILKIEDKKSTKTPNAKRDETVSKNLEGKNPSDRELKAKETVASTCGTPKQLPSSAPLLMNIPKHQIEIMKNMPKEMKETLAKMQKDQQSFQKIFEESIKKTGSSSSTSNMDASSGSGKKNILEIAQQLYKKTKFEQDSKNNAVKAPMPSQTPSAAACSTSSTATSPITVPNVQKIAIPRLNNQRVVKPPKKNQKYENATHQTLANLHSSSLGLNYTVSVGKQTRDLLKQPYMGNGTMGSHGVHSRNGENPVTSPRSAVEQSKSNVTQGVGYLVQPCPISPQTTEAKTGRNSPRNPKMMHSPKPSLASPAPRTELVSLPPTQSFSPRNVPSPNLNPGNPSPNHRSGNPSPKPSSSNSSPKPRRSNPSPRSNVPSASSSTSSAATPALTANQLLEKYNIQNLAQLSASMNFNAAMPQGYLNSMSGKQMSAFHQAMLMNQLQNRQNWFNINQAPLLQYEKYLQTLAATKNQIMGNLKDN